MMDKDLPLVRDAKKAHDTFLYNEPRDLFYYVARELVDLSIEGKTKIRLAEAIAVLLQTWNRAYYRYRSFNEEHFSDLESILANGKATIEVYRKRRIHSLNEKDKDTILLIFREFEEVLGPVGAAKALHLLAPHFFPIWDRKIAYQYKLGLGPRGKNAAKYYSFMDISKRQYENIMNEFPRSVNILKLLDEYNYCKYTKAWI